MNYITSNMRRSSPSHCKDIGIRKLDYEFIMSYDFIREYERLYLIHSARFLLFERQQ